MENLYRALNIPVSFLNSKFNGKKYTSRHGMFDKSDISDDFLKWIQSLDLTLGHAEIFFSVPHTYYTIHQDQHTIVDFPKINFIYGESTSFMNWYKNKPEKTGTISQTKIDTPYVGYALDEVDLLYSTEIKSPSLVQAGVPHNVTVVNGFRWSVSTVYTRNTKLLTFDEMVETFRPFLI
jgi:hypothetical protein